MGDSRPSFVINLFCTLAISVFINIWCLLSHTARSDGICDKYNVPSVSSISRILRNKIGSPSHHFVSGGLHYEKQTQAAGISSNQFTTPVYNPLYSGYPAPYGGVSVGVGIGVHHHQTPAGMTGIGHSSSTTSDRPSAWPSSHRMTDILNINLGFPRNLQVAPVMTTQSGSACPSETTTHSYNYYMYLQPSNQHQPSTFVSSNISASSVISNHSLVTWGYSKRPFKKILGAQEKTRNFGCSRFIFVLFNQTKIYEFKLVKNNVYVL